MFWSGICAGRVTVPFARDETRDGSPSLYLAPNCLVVLMDIDADGVHRGEQEDPRLSLQQARETVGGQQLAASRKHNRPTTAVMLVGKIWPMERFRYPIFSYCQSLRPIRLYVMRLSAHDAQHPELEVHDERRFRLRNQ